MKSFMSCVIDRQMRCNCQWNATYLIIDDGSNFPSFGSHSAMMSGKRYFTKNVPKELPFFPNTARGKVNVVTSLIHFLLIDLYMHRYIYSMYVCI